MANPKLLIFASGSATGGGSGFEKLVLAARSGVLRAEIVGVVSNHLGGGVHERANRLGIPFDFSTGPWGANTYRSLVGTRGADFVALSGWLLLVKGLDPARTFNIHPGPLPDFGGKGMYGHHVHEAVLAAYHEGKLKHSAVCMHFVTGEYDRGPVFFRLNVPIREDETPDALGSRVNAQEHIWQPRITDLVVNGGIGWDGRDSKSLRVPDGYEIERTIE